MTRLRPEVIAALVLVSSAAAAADFPLRNEYPDVVPITTAELGSANAVVVDARDSAEFEVIHIAGAHLLEIGKMRAADLEKLRSKTGDPRLLVFYCNGITCAKSYKAAVSAMAWGFAGVRCYDAGIFSWATSFPERAVFFGDKLTAKTLKTALISEAQFRAALLAPADFLAKTKAGGWALFDIRAANERSEHPIELPGVRVMLQDTFVDLLKQGDPSIPKSKLLFVDNVGKQVVWLQYHLRRNGVTEYRFLEGGVRNWVDKGFGPNGRRM